MWWQADNTCVLQHEVKIVTLSLEMCLVLRKYQARSENQKRMITDQAHKKPTVVVMMQEVEKMEMVLITKQYEDQPEKQENRKDMDNLFYGEYTLTKKRRWCNRLHVIIVNLKDTSYCIDNLIGQLVNKLSFYCWSEETAGVNRRFVYI